MARFKDLADFRAQTGDQYSDWTDEELAVAIYNQVRPQVDFNTFAAGITQRNDPGFGTSVKRSLGGLAASVGEIAGDILPGVENNNALTRYGENVEFRNPSGINSLQDVYDKPGLAFREALGSAATFLGPQIGLRAGGAALQGLRMARGARALNNPLTQTAVAGLPSVHEIGQSQRETGEEDLLAKYGGAAAVGAIETAFGVQRALGLTGRAAQGSEQLAKDFAKAPWRTAAKEVGKMGLQEGLEEIPQTFIERAAGGKEVFSPEGMEEAALGGVMGTLGGLGLGPLGAYSNISRANRQYPQQQPAPAPAQDQPQDLLARATTPPTDLGLDIPEQNVVDARGAFNPYDVGGGVTALQQGAQFAVDDPQQDIFTPYRNTGFITEGDLAAQRAVEQEQIAAANTYTPEQVEQFGLEGAIAQGSPATHDAVFDDPSFTAEERGKIFKKTGEVREGATKLLKYLTDLPLAQLPDRINDVLGSAAGWKSKLGELVLKRRQEAEIARVNAQPATIVPKEDAPTPAAGVTSVKVEELKPMPTKAGKLSLKKKAKPESEFAAGVAEVATPVAQPATPTVSQPTEAPAATEAAPESPTPEQEAGSPLEERMGRLRNTVNAIMRNSGLSERDFELLQALYTDEGLDAGKKGKALAKQYGVSESRVSQVKNREKVAMKLLQGGKALGMSAEETGAVIGDFFATARMLSQQETAAAEETGAPQMGTELSDEERATYAPELGAGRVDEEGEAAAGTGKVAVENIDHAAEKDRLQNASLYLVDQDRMDEAADVAKLAEQGKYREANKLLNELLGADEATKARNYAMFDKGRAPSSRELASAGMTSYRGQLQTSGRLTLLTRLAGFRVLEIPENLAQFLGTRGWIRRNPETGKYTIAVDAKLFQGDPRQAEWTLQHETSHLEDMEGGYSQTEEFAQLMPEIEDAHARGFAWGVLNYPLAPSKRPSNDAALKAETFAQLRALWNAFGGKGKVIVTRDLPSVARFMERVDADVQEYIREGESRAGDRFAEGAGERSRAERRLPIRALAEAQGGRDAAAAETEEGLASQGEVAFNGEARIEQIVRDFTAQVQRVVNADARGQPVQELIKLADNTPASLQVFGFTDLPIYVRPGDNGVLKIVFDHGITPKEVGSLIPQTLRRPKLILQHRENNGTESLQFVGARAGGAPIVIAIQPEKGGTSAAPANHLVATAFAPADGWKYVEKGVRNGDLLYRDTNGGLPPSTNSAFAEAQKKFALAPRVPLGIIPKRASVRGQAYKVLGQSDLVKWEQENWPDGALFDRSETVNFDKVPQPLRPKLESIWTTIKDLAKKGQYSLSFVHDLVDAGKQLLPSGAEFARLLAMRGAARREFEVQIEKVADRFAQLSPKRREVVNAFLFDSTWEKKWAYRPSWIEEGDETFKIDPAMQAKFQALPAEEQQIVRDAFEHGHKTLQRKMALVNKAILQEYAPALENAQQEGERQAILKERAQRIKNAGEFLTKLTGPYVPLKRFGRYVVVGRSQALEDARAVFREEPTRQNEKAVYELEADPDHYYVTFADTLGEANRIATELGDQFDHAESFEKEQWFSHVRELPFTALQKVKQALSHEENVTDEVRGKMNSLLRDLYITSLSEYHARQTQNKRRYVAGADRDAMRAFVAQGRADANFISQLEYGDQLSDHVYTMRREVVNGETGTRGERARLLNAFIKHYADNIEYRPTPLQDKMMSMASFWMLLTSPSYYAQNLTQPFMLSLPVMAGRHGYANAASALTAGYRDLREVLKSYQVGGGLELGKMTNRLGDERGMLEEMRNLGLADIGIDADMGRFEETRTGFGLVDTASKGAQAVMRKMQGIARSAEVVNRVSTALAAYRLHYAAEIQRGRTAKQAHQDAVDYTAGILRQTHGDYSNVAAPLFFKQLPKVVTQFRKFQLVQVSILARLVHQSFKGASAQEKLIARKALGYILGHAFVATGALGLPAANLVALALSAVGGDEPKDLEKTLREAIGDQDLADLLLKGAPAALGVDVSRRIGWGQSISILPFTDVDLTSRKGLGEAALGVAGPFVGGMLPRMADGLGLVGKGDYYKGLELMAPKGLTDMMRGYRQAVDGVTLKNNDVVLKAEELTLFDAFMQGLGLPSMGVTRRQWAQGVAIEADKFFSARSSELRHRYSKAYRAGDSAEMAELRAEWMDLQQARQRNGFTMQSLSTLMRAPLEQAKRERASAGGVEFTKSSRGAVERLAGL